MFAAFKEGSGEIYKIGNAVDVNENRIAVSYPEVEAIMQGKEPMSDYVVEFDGLTKSLQFKKRDVASDNTIRGNILYQVPTTYLNDPDITLVQTGNKWTLVIGDKLQSNMAKHKVNLNFSMYFGITSKDDPNVVYDTLKFDFAQPALIKDLQIPHTDVSIYTSKKFDTYRFYRTTDDIT